LDVNNASETFYFFIDLNSFCIERHKKNNERMEAEFCPKFSLKTGEAEFAKR